MQDVIFRKKSNITHTHCMGNGYTIPMDRVG